MTERIQTHLTASKLPARGEGAFASQIFPLLPKYKNMPPVRPLPTLTDAKLARVEEFKLLSSPSVISKQEYETEILKLNARQNKEDAKREAKEAERERARVIARLAKEEGAGGEA
jgi:hypothetical protein